MLTVAFATTDRARVDQHFGAARGFAIYELEPRRARLVGIAEFSETDQDGNEGKLAARIAAITGCAAVYCLAVGGSAVRQLLAAGIQPIRLDEPVSIEELLGELRRALQRGGVAWIDRALKRNSDDGGRFARMAAEGWQE